MATTDMITDAIKTLARVTEAISAYVLFAGGRLNCLMPTAQFDQFENLERPVIQAECKTEAYKLWDRLSAERDHYLDGVEAELRGVGP